MSYNKEALPNYMKTAGKISVFAAVSGLAVFMLAFMVDVGQQEFQRAAAQQTATTSLTVLNTPPQFTLPPYEVTPSTTTSPTNSGDEIVWEAIGTDSNGAPYFLIVCSDDTVPPMATGAADEFSLGTAPPTCGSGVTWGVSTSTLSGELASVSTTTSEAAGSQFTETNVWYAWVCDDDPTQPACNLIGQQGDFATSSSPFNMNRRPTLTSTGNDGPVDPSSLLTFTTVSTDVDTDGGADDLTIVVCQSASYDDVTNTCATDFLTTTSVTATDNVSATTTTPAIIRDGTYPAFVYLVDEHGHEATPNGLNADFTINNVAPTIAGGDIALLGVGGVPDLTLTNPGGETEDFVLNFTVSDANSCVNAASSSEITGFEVAVLRAGPSNTYSTSTNCNPQAGDYNPNGCYTHVGFTATTTWNLDCTAVATSCTSPLDDTQEFECTFPLWFLADPTDAGPETPAAFAGDDWIAAVAGGDDNFATSSLVAGDIAATLFSNTALELVSAVIPYGALAPGFDTGTLSTSTIVRNIGNTGLDQELEGTAMCPGFINSTGDCSLNATSTIFTSNQEFGLSSVTAYGSGTALPTSTLAIPAELDIDVNKTTATSTPNTGETFWGIAVPAAITIAGSYTGLNTFSAVTAEAVDW